MYHAQFSSSMFSKAGMVVKSVVGNRRGATAGVPDAQRKWAVVGLNLSNKFIVMGTKSSSFLKQHNGLLESTWGRHFFRSNWSQVNEITIIHSRHQIVTCHRCQAAFSRLAATTIRPINILWIPFIPSLASYSSSAKQPDSYGSEGPFSY